MGASQLLSFLFLFLLPPLAVFAAACWSIAFEVEPGSQVERRRGESREESGWRCEGADNENAGGATSCKLNGCRTPRGQDGVTITVTRCMALPNSLRPLLDSY